MLKFGTNNVLNTTNNIKIEKIKYYPYLYLYTVIWKFSLSKR